MTYGQLLIAEWPTIALFLTVFVIALPLTTIYKALINPWLEASLTRLRARWSKR